VVTRALPALAALLLAASCSPSGDTCGLGRCEVGAHCVTLFTGTFESKAASPGTDVDHNYWCLGPCPSSKKCPGQCLQDPADDTIVACSGNSVSMELHCPSTLGADVDGTCSSFDITACYAAGTRCGANSTCPLGVLPAGRVIGPIAVDVGQGDPLFIDTSAIAHTTDANPPLSTNLPQGVTPRLNVPESCSN
jgi:hypothetical protein